MSRFEKFVGRIKNNPIIALVVAVGTVVIALSTFTGAVRNLYSTIVELVGPPAPIDITGIWRADTTEKTPKTYFEFKIIDNKLFGSVAAVREFESGILNGHIKANQVSFTTKNGSLITDYEGEIKGDSIYFRQLKDGYYVEMIANRIVDLTVVSSEGTSYEKKNIYRLAYTLDGHEGGVRSLSFGPDKGRLRTGGLRLQSGGEQDGQLKAWDIATAEHYHTLTYKGGRVYNAFSPKTREGSAYFTGVAVRKDGHHVTFFHYRARPIGMYSGGYWMEDFQGVVGPVAISGDSNLVAIAATESTSKSTIMIWNQKSDVRRMLKCEGVVHAMALSFNGGLLASAESRESNEALLKLQDVTTEAIQWKISSRPFASYLVFSPDDSMLAFVAMEDSQISILDASSGSRKFLFSGEKDNRISSLTFSNTGEWLASASHPSGLIQLWNTSTGKLDHTINNEAPVGVVAFSYDDRLLGSGDTDKGFIRIWAKSK